MFRSLRPRLLLSTLMVASLARAQDKQAPAPETPANGEGIYTLHIYPTLFQIPTLLLPYNPAFPITQTFGPADFSISIDSGPTFHPETARRAGDDLLDIEILLDASGEQNDTLKVLAPALRSAVVSELHPQDTVAIYAVDCQLLNSTHILASAPDSIEQATTRILTDPRLHGSHTRSACQSTLALWDAIAVASRMFPARPSRRVLLVLSEGDDAKSKLTFDQATQLVRANGIAVFGLRNGMLHDAEAGNKERLYRLGLTAHADLLATLVGLEGGTIYDTGAKKLEANLEQFLRDLRDRYILEFEAPADPKAGLHSIAIRVSHDRATAHPAPLSAAIPDPARATDPTVLPSGTRAPVFGTKPPR